MPEKLRLLIEVDPEGSKEWDKEKNSKNNLFIDSVTAYSAKRAWWLCPKGHSYDSIISNHTGGSRCPICANKKVLIGFNDLKTIDTEGVKEWDYAKNDELDVYPDKITSMSSKRVWWICQKGHEYNMAVSCHSRGERCPYCAKKKILTGFNDLLTVDPDGIKEWDYEKNNNLKLYPNKLASSSKKKAWWICPKNHSYTMAIGNHTRGQRCPYCANIKVLSGFNDLKTIDPEGVKEWDYEENAKLGFYPDKVFPNMMKPKLHWKCPKGHSYEMIANSHTYGARCPYCANAKVLTGYNDLATIDPDGVKEWDHDKNSKLGFYPDKTPPRSDKVVWWICSKKHSYSMRLADHSEGHRCPYCNNKKVWVGYNDLKTIDPEGAKEWNYKRNDELGISIDEITPRSSKKVWWICPKGHEYDMLADSHAAGQRCPYCSNTRVLSGYNDLATIDPEGVKEWDYDKNSKLGFYPDKTAPHMMSPKLYWICPKGHSYMMNACNHTSGHRCPVCNESKGEKKISMILDCLKIEYIPQYTFEDCKNKKKLPFDFAIIKNHKPILIVEYDGLHHFEPVRFGGISEEKAKINFDNMRANDELKNNYCKEQKIPILRIPYTKFDKLEEILINELHKCKIITKT